MEAYVRSTTVDELTTIEFFHPAHNSLPGDILRQLKEAIEKAGDSDDSKLIVIKSGGERTFCAGASFDELVAIQNKEDGKEFFLGFARVINAMRKCPKLIIGRIQGKTVGGGVGLASGFDYCLATKFAQIRLSELAVGIGPFVIGPAVERKCGLSAFSSMSITPNEWQSAEYAKSVGLFAKVFDSTSDLDEYIEKFTQELLTMNPVAIRELKKVFWEGTNHWDELLDKRAQASGELVLSAYAKKAISKFLQK